MALCAELISTPKLGSDVSLKQEKQGFGLFEMQGLRPSQEDAAVGRWYSQNEFIDLSPWEIGQRLWTTYKLINKQCCHSEWGGSTASTTVYDGKGNFITATVGDSVAFAVIYTREGGVSSVTRLNTVTHHPEEDAERLEQVGGIIIEGRVHGQHGSLAVSRAIGDHEYSAFGICDEAHIDIHHKAELALGLMGKIQIITTCDGFTDAASACTKKSHEQWMMFCLQSIKNINHLPESELAMHLAFAAFKANSPDNISVAVQTLSDATPFLIGVFDGHAGIGTSSCLAMNVGTVFDQQCTLSSQEYAQQRLSAHRYFETFYRDNKDLHFYEPLAAEKNSRLGELSKPGGMHEHLQCFILKKNELVDEVVVSGENIAAPMQALLAVEDVRIFIDLLCVRYLGLELDKQEFLECLKYVLQNEETPAFRTDKYDFLPFDFKKHQESIYFLKEHHGFSQLFEGLVASFLEQTAGLNQHGLFKAAQETLKSEASKKNLKDSDYNLRPKGN